MKRFVALLVLLIGPMLLIGQEETLDTPYVFDLRGDTVHSAERGQRLLVFLDTPYVEEYRVFLGNRSIHPLDRYDSGGPGWYTFKVPYRINGEPIADLYGLEKKDVIRLPLNFGKDLNHIIAGTSFTIVIDPKQGLRRRLSIGMALFLALLLAFIIYRGDLMFIRDSTVEGIEAKPPFSLSKTQFAWWTLMILFSLFYVWIYTEELVEINGRILTLLGISAGTTLGSKYISEGNRSRRNVTEAELKKGSTSFLSDLIWSGKGPSIHRMQNLIFTIVISLYFIYEVVQNIEFPVLDEGLLILMGISSGTYLALKSEEGKEKEEDQAVG